MQNKYNAQRNRKRQALRRSSVEKGTTDEGATVGPAEGDEATVDEGGAVESDHELDLDAWVQAVGSPKKGCLIGFGPRVDARSILGSSSTAPRNWKSRYSATSSQADVRVDELARQLEEERQRTEEALRVMQQQQQQREEEHVMVITEATFTECNFCR